MSELSQSLVDAAAEAASAVDCPHIADLDYGQSSCQPCEVRAAVAAVLETLAAKPDGYLRHTEDGGVTYTRTLRRLAEEIKEGR